MAWAKSSSVNSRGSKGAFFFVVGFFMKVLSGIFSEACAHQRL
jgi:hypothetical protein